MKTKNYIFSLLSAICLLFVVGCSPDKYSLGDTNYISEDLVEGVNFSVSVAEDNTVTLKSLMDKSYHCYWKTPNGYDQGDEVTFSVPFAGEYEVSFGIDTRGGVVYSKPYTFTISTNNMSLLSDKLYTYLTGGVGKEKKWVPVDKDYGVGQTVGPMTYCNPDDVLNDGSKSTDLAYEHWAPNWDPGFQGWLVTQDSPYMDSYMTFGLSDTKGCYIEEYRGESGSKGASTGTTLSGRYKLDLSDATHPKLSFVDGTYCMHLQGFDETCENYTTDLYIVELTEYILQIATMRTNDEGAWWLVWSFIAEDVQNGTVTIPSGEVETIDTKSPTLPEYADLATSLFTTDLDGVTYTGNKMTFTINEDQPYDWYWWNGAEGVELWQAVVDGNYNDTWAPAVTDDVTENELTLAKTSAGYTYTFGDATGTCTIGTNTITFENEVTFVGASNDNRTVSVTGKEFTVIKCDPGSELIIGVPATTDEDGNVNSYLCVNLEYKSISTGGSTTVTVPFTADNVNNYIEAEKYFRCQLYNPWGGGGDAVDPANLSMKKNQTIKVTVKLSGFTFTQTAKMVLCLNRGSEQSWEPDCFDYSRAIEVNGDGTYTVSWTNDTGSTAKWSDGTSALTITMQYTGYATVEKDADDTYKSACTVESIIIE